MTALAAEEKAAIFLDDFLAAGGAGAESYDDLPDAMTVCLRELSLMRMTLDVEWSVRYWNFAIYITSFYLLHFNKDKPNRIILRNINLIYYLLGAFSWLLFRSSIIIL